MPIIVSFAVGTTLSMPTQATHFPIHLGEAEGRHYLSVPEDFTIPDHQPTEVDYRVHAEPLSPGVRKSLTSVREIDRTCVEKIRSRYSVDDELGAVRTGDPVVLGYVEQCVAEARVAKAALGL
ncbi:MAG: hypothetical protein H7Y60_16465 [Rhodospirillaceae bacterium]|nr:hypothetical protein [Rhodospirillales bacterium]